VPFAWFVVFRYLRDGKSQTALILAAVSVGVAVVVFLSALISGLQTSLVEKTLGSQAHVTVQVAREVPRPLTPATTDRAIARVVQPTSHRLRSIDGWPALLLDIERMTGVTAASPTVVGAAFAVRADAKEAVFVQGVDPERFLAIMDVCQKIVAGRFDLTSGQVAIGSTLARELNVGIADKIRITTTEGIEDIVTVSGVFTFGNESVDRTWIITSLRHAQSIYALPGGATTIQIKVADVFDADRIGRELHDRAGVDADSWMKLNAALLTGLSAQNNSKALIQFFVVIAVALGIASVLAVSVVQKTREIGIMRAVGTASRRVLEIFLIQGGVLGLVGSVIGSAFGALLAKLFENLARGPDGTPQFPIALDLSIFVGATILATTVGLLAAVLPARRASRIDPALAIRNG
jgi:lipoprotein-releasing system permease protein